MKFSDLRKRLNICHIYITCTFSSRPPKLFFAVFKNMRSNSWYAFVKESKFHVPKIWAWTSWQFHVPDPTSSLFCYPSVRPCICSSYASKIRHFVYIALHYYISMIHGHSLATVFFSTKTGLLSSRDWICALGTISSGKNGLSLQYLCVHCMNCSYLVAW